MRSPRVRAGAVSAVLLLCLSGARPSAAAESAKSTAGGVCRPTAENIEGPYYLPGAPFRERILADHTSGRELEITGTVYEADCVTPLEGAVLDVWQTDAAGEYDFSRSFLLRGRVRTDSRGRYRIETILPGRYRAGRSYRPAHVHLLVSHPKGRTLITQIYFEGDPYNRYDPFVDPSLMVPLRKSTRDGKDSFSAVFDIVLDRPPSR